MGELYNLLLRAFVSADCDFDGQVSQDEFGGMISAAAALPKKFGFDWWQGSPADMFKAIDENGDGSVSFDEWLSFAYKNYQGQKDLPAAFDKQDKDQFVALQGILEHRFRELQEDLLVLLEVLPGSRRRQGRSSFELRVPDDDLDRDGRPEASRAARPVPAGGGEGEDLRQDGRERGRVHRVQRVARLLPSGNHCSSGSALNKSDLSRP